MSIIRWVILRHTQDYNSEVLSDEEESTTLKSLPQIKPTALKDTTESSPLSDTPTDNKPGEQNTTEVTLPSESKTQVSQPEPNSGDVETEKEDIPAMQSESQESLPPLVLPAVSTAANKDVKTARKGEELYPVATYCCHLCSCDFDCNKVSQFTNFHDGYGSAYKLM